MAMFCMSRRYDPANTNSFNCCRSHVQCNTGVFVEKAPSRMTEQVLYFPEASMHNNVNIG